MKKTWKNDDELFALAKEKLFEIVVGSLLFIGSSINIASAFGWKKESTTWRLEMIGWPMLAGAWGLYSAFVIVGGPTFEGPEGPLALSAEQVEETRRVMCAPGTRLLFAPLKLADMTWVDKERGTR